MVVKQARNEELPATFELEIAPGAQFESQPQQSVASARSGVEEDDLSSVNNGRLEPPRLLSFGLRWKAVSRHHWWDTRRQQGHSETRRSYS